MHGSDGLFAVRQFGFDEHFVLQSAVVHAERRILGKTREIGFLDRRSCLCFGILRFGTSLGFSEGFTRRKAGIGVVRLLLLGENRRAIVQTFNLVALHALHVEHRIDRALDRERLFWLIAQRFHGSIASPTLHHHQQIEAVEMFRVVALEIVGRISHKAFQIGREQQFGQHISVVVGSVVGVGIAH